MQKTQYYLRELRESGSNSPNKSLVNSEFQVNNSQNRRAIPRILHKKKNQIRVLSSDMTYLETAENRENHSLLGIYNSIAKDLTNINTYE